MSQAEWKVESTQPLTASVSIASATKAASRSISA
jgi:hypothetical protein